MRRRGGTRVRRSMSRGGLSLLMTAPIVGPGLGHAAPVSSMHQCSGKSAGLRGCRAGAGVGVAIVHGRGGLTALRTAHVGCV